MLELLGVFSLHKQFFHHAHFVWLTPSLQSSTVYSQPPLLNTQYWTSESLPFPLFHFVSISWHKDKQLRENMEVLLVFLRLVTEVVHQSHFFGS